MNRFRKAISVGMSAALLASLFTTIAATAVLAGTTTVTGGGPINPGGPASTAITIKAVEDSATLGEWTDGTDTITLTDSAGGSTIRFSGTPVVTASGGPAPFACSASLNVTKTILSVACTGTTNTRLDSFTVTGLSIKALTGAAIGGVVGTWAGTMDLGTTNTTASGTVPAVTGAPAAQIVVVTLDAGSAAFQLTSATPPPSKAHVAGGAPEDVSLTAVGAATATQSVTGVFLNSHGALTAITQTVPANRLSGLPVVGDTITVTSATTLSPVRQGVNNQAGNDIVVDFGKAGFAALNSTITLSISSAGEQFSGYPTVSLPTTLRLSAGVLSGDRKSITYKVTTASTNDNETATFSNIRLDVAGSAVQGSTVDVALVAAPAVSVVGSPVSIAQVGSTLIGVGAVPIVLIGFNDQPTGLLTLTETAAGTLSDDVSGATDIVRVCLANANKVFFLRQPWAVVTAGDLKLNSGGLPATQVKMTLSPGGLCASFLIYSQSTVASTVQIRGGIDAASTAPLASGPNNGPKVSVTITMDPGPVTIQVKQAAGTILTNTDGSFTGPLVVVAMAAFAGSPAVTALSQPFISRNAQQAAGSITIEETFAGQFQQGEEIELCTVPRSLTNQQDVYFSTSFYDTSNPLTANQPLVTTNNATGLVAYFEGFENSTSGAGSSQGIGYSCLEVHISGAPVSGLGKITISNIRYDVVADAAFGPVQLNVFRESNGGEGGDIVAGANFNQTVSNATIGTAPIGTGTATTRLGATQVGAFTVATKIAKLTKYVTYRFDFGVAAAGQLVKVWGATKSGNDWSAFTVVTSRVANASGVVYYYIRQSAATWKSYRAMWAGGNAWTPARQARWVK